MTNSGLQRILVLMLAVAQLACCGCAWSRWNRKGEMAAFGPKVPCRLPPHASAEEIVAHLNQNVDKLHGWQAREVKLRANNMPLQALIAVEQGQHLRILVSSIAGSEMDLGCNQDVFWFWAKRNPEPAVMYASHEQIDLVRETLQIPFEPGWLMEALGVAKIPLDGATVEPGKEQATSLLVSQHVSATGRTIRKAITVDTCHGRVLEHSIWDGGNRIAHATFSQHRLDPETGVVLPHQIRIEWPQADVSLVMNLGHVEINPTDLPESIWHMPQMRDYPVVNLEDVAQRRNGGRRPVQVTEQPPRRQEAVEEFWQPHQRTEADATSDAEEPADLDGEEPYVDEPYLDEPLSE